MILIFGGTTEGRIVSSILDESGKEYFYSTKGAFQEIDLVHGERVSGAMTHSVMRDFIREKEISLVIDAAHPFAAILHKTIGEVTAELSIPVIRYERKYSERTGQVVECASYEEIIQKLEAQPCRRLLALTGVNTIPALKPFWSKHESFFRILDREDSREKAEAAGFPFSHIRYFHEGEDQALFVERLCPDFFPLKTGFTTGSTATAATAAALHALLHEGEVLTEATIILPSGEEVRLPVEQVVKTERGYQATARKYSGDDPDVTHLAEICSEVVFTTEHEGIRFLQGEGVGIVTLPGLGLEIGGPAINKTPRAMMETIVRRHYPTGGIDITISIPRGRDLASKTFNPRLGIIDGISVVGTSGVVKPFSLEAFVASIVRQADVAVALGADTIVINSGAKSEKYLKNAFPELPFQSFVQYGNFIGETLDKLAQLAIPKIYMGIMLGKAVKLAEGNLDTHSRKVVMNKDFMHRIARESGCSEATHTLIDSLTLARELWTGLTPDDLERFMFRILDACYEAAAKLVPESELSILLIDDDGNIRYTFPHNFLAQH